MWKLLADLAVVYCAAASWRLATGNLKKARELVEIAGTCLKKRKRTCEDGKLPQDVLEVEN